jgi:hypothetical protein
LRLAIASEFDPCWRQKNCPLPSAVQSSSAPDCRAAAAGWGVRFDSRYVALDIRRCSGEPAAASVDNKSG